jgi:hypothetical protein
MPPTRAEKPVVASLATHPIAAANNVVASCAASARIGEASIKLATRPFFSNRAGNPRNADQAGAGPNGPPARGASGAAEGQAPENLSSGERFGDREELA